ncbi:hypothetical protein P2W50_31445 [Pseudomonas protegens]|uniref:hypothetical protein n=1 Tax=Pseudomonas protegens TaxID=380021 RepID=UPI0023EB5F81|nr:hypothetical protein [Pseudomonas protegens]MDF4211169.1 hypothetical protein [Pseudomonas protegens]
MSFIATLFYFPSAQALKGFHSFEVASHGGKPGLVFTVTGQDRSTDKLTVLAEFPAQGMAETFRDMCAVVSLH